MYSNMLNSPCEKETLAELLVTLALTQKANRQESYSMFWKILWSTFRFNSSGIRPARNLNIQWIKVLPGHASKHSMVWKLVLWEEHSTLAILCFTGLFKRNVHLLQRYVGGSFRLKRARLWQTSAILLLSHLVLS